MALKSGSIRLANDPTRAGEWAVSMSKAIEDAFLDEWPEAMDGAPKPEMNDQMRLMFVAVAKGVIKHLTENGSAFLVDSSSLADHTHNYTLAPALTILPAGGHDHSTTTTITGTIDS